MLREYVRFTIRKTIAAIPKMTCVSLVSASRLIDIGSMVGPAYATYAGPYEDNDATEPAVIPDKIISTKAISNGSFAAKNKTPLAPHNAPDRPEPNTKKSLQKRVL